MPTTYVPNAANNPTVIRHAVDGDPPNETVMIAPMVHDLADYAGKTRELVLNIGDHVLSATPSFLESKWSKFATNMQSVAGNTGNASTEVLDWGTGHIPSGRSITKYGVSITPAGAHAGLPGQKPRIRLIKVLFSSGASTVVDEETDGSTTLGQYEAHHTITKTLGTPELVDSALYGYFVEFIHESGANAIQAGMSVQLARISWS